MNISRDKSGYLRKKKVFAEFGLHSTMSSKVIPLYPELISIGNNVRMAAKVSLIPHDMIHAMLNNRSEKGLVHYKEYMGCIRIDDNVFVGACTTILANVHIGSNVIIGAGSLVNKDLEGGYVYAGVPAKKICSFDEFIEKRSRINDYPDGLGRIGLTGNQGDLDLLKVDDPYFHGKSAATLWFLLKEGKIAKIEGLEDIDQDPRIVANIQRLHEGDTVPPEWVGTERQVLTRLYIICDSKLALADAITEYRQKVRVTSEQGKDMLLKGFSLKRMMEE